MKILTVVSSLDLRHPFSCTPAWWQLLKGLYEIGVEVVATPYQGPAVESLWWRAYENPCRLEGNLFRVSRDLLRRVPTLNKGRRETSDAGESAADRAVRTLANKHIRPRWERHISRILEREGDIDVVLILSVPLNHLTGLPTTIKRHYGVAVIYYDGDVPASLPAFQGFASGFKIYQGADLAEYDAFISNSKGGAAELERTGAKNVHVLYYGADPEIFSPMNIEQDIDVFFYGHTTEYRREWIEAMISEPSRWMDGTRFAVRGTGLDIDLGHVERLPYLSFSKLREYCCRSKINLSIIRQAHASVYASSASRPFELAAMGCCIVSNPVKGIEEWFEPGEEVFVVQDRREVIELYQWLLSHSEERRQVGEAARARVLAEHTFRHRARELVQILERVGK